MQLFYLKLYLSIMTCYLLTDSISLSSLHLTQNQDLTGYSIPQLPLQRGVSTWLLWYKWTIPGSYNFQMQTLVSSLSSFLPPAWDPDRNLEVQQAARNLNFSVILHTKENSTCSITVEGFLLLAAKNPLKWWKQHLCLCLTQKTVPSAPLTEPWTSPFPWQHYVSINCHTN